MNEGGGLPAIWILFDADNTCQQTNIITAKISSPFQLQMTAPVISGLQWLTTDCLHFVRLELSARSGLLSMDVEVKVTSASVKIAAIRESTKTTLSLLVRTFVTIVMLRWQM